MVGYRGAWICLCCPCRVHVHVELQVRQESVSWISRRFVRLNFVLGDREDLGECIALTAMQVQVAHKTIARAWCAVAPKGASHVPLP